MKYKDLTMDFADTCVEYQQDYIINRDFFIL